MYLCTRIIFIYSFTYTQYFLKMMAYLTVLLILLRLIIPMIVSLQMNCYSNASLILPPSTIQYNNLTLQSCKCLTIEQSISGFQYNNDEQSCYTFGNDSLLSDIRIKINCQVCFVNRTSTV
jgi:hypothetical protein